MYCAHHTQSTLDTFLGFFRGMYNAKFDVDDERSVVSISGSSTVDTTLNAAQCLQHALYVCREDGFQVGAAKVQDRGNLRQGASRLFSAGGVRVCVCV